MSHSGENAWHRLPLGSAATDDPAFAAEIDREARKSKAVRLAGVIALYPSRWVGRMSGTFGDTPYRVMDGREYPLGTTDTRLSEDDIAALVRTGLIRPADVTAHDVIQQHLAESYTGTRSLRRLFSSVAEFRAAVGALREARESAPIRVTSLSAGVAAASTAVSSSSLLLRVPPRIAEQLLDIGAAFVRASHLLDAQGMSADNARTLTSLIAAAEAIRPYVHHIDTSDHTRAAIPP
jgi:hypothetical protein